MLIILHLFNAQQSGLYKVPLPASGTCLAKWPWLLCILETHSHNWHCCLQRIASSLKMIESTASSWLLRLIRYITGWLILLIAPCTRILLGSVAATLQSLETNRSLWCTNHKQLTTVWSVCAICNMSCAASACYWMQSAVSGDAISATWMGWSAWITESSPAHVYHLTLCGQKHPKVGVTPPPPKKKKKKGVSF